MFPESAGDFLGEGESKQPSPEPCLYLRGEIQLENLILLPALGVLCPWEPAWLFREVLNQSHNPCVSHLRDGVGLLESAGCCLRSS